MCSNSVVKLCETIQMFVMVEYVRVMTVKKSCMVYEDHLSICSSCFSSLLSQHINNIFLM